MRREEKGNTIESEKKNEGEKMRSSFLEVWVYGTRDSCMGLGITKLLSLIYSTKTVIRATLL